MPVCFSAAYPRLVPGQKEFLKKASKPSSLTYECTLAYGIDGMAEKDFAN